MKGLAGQPAGAWWAACPKPGHRGIIADVPAVIEEHLGAGYLVRCRHELAHRITAAL